LARSSFSIGEPDGAIAFSGPSEIAGLAALRYNSEIMTARALLLIPCYNEAARLPGFLEQIAATPLTSAAQVDVVLLDDGSRSDEAHEMQAAADRLGPAFVAKGLTLKMHRFDQNQGKGGVLRFGLREWSPGYTYAGFLDADGSTQFADWLRLVERLAGDAQLDAAIGSRMKMLGYVVERHFKRFLSGRIFATLLSEMFQIPVYDSQCGAKVFRSSALTPALLGAADNSRWLFDTQLVLFLYHSGHKIIEVPVNWIDCAGSKVSLLRDSVRMFVQLLGIRASFHEKLEKLPKGAR
jgi:dolichyl-phosphate beta-glucosyltransferase